MFLALSWTGQAFALGCQEMTDGMAMDMADQDHQESTTPQMEHGCKDCQKSQHSCLKAAEKNEPFLFSAKLKVESLKAVQTNPLETRTAIYQIRGPDIKPKVLSGLKSSPVTLQIRLQV